MYASNYNENAFQRSSTKYASSLSRPGLLSVLQFNMPSLLHDAPPVHHRGSPDRLFQSHGYTSSQEESLPVQKNRNHHSSKALSRRFHSLKQTHFSSAMLAPYELHPATTASTGEGREMADKLLDLSTGVDMAGGE